MNPSARRITLLLCALTLIIPLMGCTSSLVTIQYRHLGDFTGYRYGIPKNPSEAAAPISIAAGDTYSIYEITAISNEDADPVAFTFSTKKLYAGLSESAKSQVVLDPKTDFQSSLAHGIAKNLKSPDDQVTVAAATSMPLHWKVVIKRDGTGTENLFYKSVSGEDVLMSRLTGSEPTDEQKAIGELTEDNFPERPRDLVRVFAEHVKSFDNYDTGGSLAVLNGDIGRIFKISKITAEEDAKGPFLLGQLRGGIISSDNKVIGAESSDLQPKLDNTVAQKFASPYLPQYQPAFANLDLGWYVIVRCKGESGLPQEAASQLYYLPGVDDNVIVEMVPSMPFKWTNSGTLDTNMFLP